MLMRTVRTRTMAPADSGGGAPDGGASSPAGTPSAPGAAAAPNAQPARAGGDTDSIWAEFVRDSDSDSNSDPGDGSAQAPGSGGSGHAGPTPATPAAQQQPAAALATPDGNQPAAAPLPTAPVAVPPAQPATALPQPTAEGAQPAFNPHDPEWQQGQREALARSFALSEEQASRMQTEPERVLPELAAHLMLSTQLWVTHFIDDLFQHYLPNVIDGRYDQRQTKATAQQAIEKDVFGPYPKLQSFTPEQLSPFAQQVRKAMPNATAKERIDRLAAVVYQLNGWPLPQATRPAAQAVAPAPAAAPAFPYVPAAPGAAPPPPTHPPANGRDPSNPWEELLT